MKGLAYGIAIGVLLSGIVVAALFLTNVIEGKRTPAPQKTVRTLRSGDTVFDPRTGTRCEATGEGGVPNVHCSRASGAGEAVFWSDALQVYGPGSQEMTPTYSFAWWGGKTCAPPRGPNDRNVHSTPLLVHGLDCAAARGLALRCARFSYGRSGRCAASGKRWFCSSVRRPGSASDETCAFRRKSISITWTD